MSISLSISELYSAIFGYESAAFEFDQVTGFADVTDLNRKEFGDYGSPYYSEDQFGREYYLPVTVSFPDKDKAKVGILGAVNSLKSWELPHPVVSIKPQKKIIKTPLTERQGSVIELSQIDLYEVTVRGVMINTTNEYPEAMMKQLKDLFVIGTPLKLRCAASDIWLNDVGYKVVLSGISIPEVRGVKNVFGYEIRFISDGIVDLVEI